jgi:hypothetical protein
VASKRQFRFRSEDVDLPFACLRLVLNIMDKDSFRKVEFASDALLLGLRKRRTLTGWWDCHYSQWVALKGGFCKDIESSEFEAHFAINFSVARFIRDN